jgi:hypothetical protein
MAKEYIKDFYGRVMGSIDTQGNKQIARDFYGRILGTYNKSDDVTRDFYGRILTKGNTLMGLIYAAKK